MAYSDNGTASSKRNEPVSLDSMLPGWLSPRIMVLGVALTITIPIVAASVSMGVRTWRIEASKLKLEENHAEFRLAQHHKPSPHENNWLAGQLSYWLNSALSPDVKQVRLKTGDPTDSQLGFLKSLISVERLELASNAATDKTIASICKMPNLRYLTLIGNKFSIMGLLQLRAVANLEQLRLNTQLYSPIEIAVLKSELPGVKLADASFASAGVFRDIQPLFEPAA